MITDPRFAPRRTDMPYLRRRSRPKARGAAPTPAPVNMTRPPASASRATPPPTRPVSAGRPDAAVADYFSGNRPRREPAHRPPVPASEPAGVPTPPGSALDLDTPAAPARAVPSTAAASPRAPVSSSLDLDSATPARAEDPVAPASRPASTSLDLDAGAAPPRQERSARSAAPAASSRARAYPADRVVAGGRTILGHRSPAVTLTRTQSGIGTLTVEAACSDEVGDLRLGCAYQLSSGQSSTVQLTGGNRLAPPRSRRPVLIAAHDRYERVSVDLRQCRDVERFAVYAFSESRAQLNWGGTLIVTTFGGAKIELPLEQLAAGGVAMLLTGYNVRGEFVLRSEMQTIDGFIREACRAYGYDQITWVDDRTPVE